MASRQVEIAGVGTVILTKRQSSRSIRLSVDHDGMARVSLPKWTSYQTGLQFALSKKDWINSQQQALQVLLKEGQPIGKAHHLRLISDPALSHISSKLAASEVIVRFPAHLTADSPAVQQAARQTSIRALRTEAETLLPKRLADLAARHDFKYKSISIRRLKSRWGSCSNKGDITLNLFLMQLPWQLIDYVLLHELVHTKVLRHGQPFWDEFTRHLPDAKAVKRDLIAHRPTF